MRITETTATKLIVAYEAGERERMGAAYTALGIDTNALVDVMRSDTATPDLIDLLSKAFATADPDMIGARLAAITPDNMVPIPGRTAGMLKHIGADAGIMFLIALSLGGMTAFEAADLIVTANTRDHTVDGVRSTYPTVRIWLDGDLHWYGSGVEMIVTREDLPETVQAALPGRPLADLLRHPLTDTIAATIASVVSTPEGTCVRLIMPEAGA